MTSDNKRKHWLPCVLIIVIALTGCGSQRIVDKINILMILGLGKSGTGFRGTGLYTDYNHGGKARLLQGNDSKPILLLDKMNTQSSQPVEIGKLELLIFDKQLAQKGITPFLGSIFKDPMLSKYLIIAVSEGSAATMLERLVGKKSSDLPYHTIKQNIQSGKLPKSNLHTFLFDYYGKGRDPSAPYLKLNPKGEIEITGYAIFKDAHLKLIINQEKMPLFKMLQGNLSGENVPFTIIRGKNEGTAVFSSLNGKESRAMSKSTMGTKVIYNITLNGIVKDHPEWLHLGKEGNDRKIIMQIEEQMRSMLLALLNKFVKDEVDPLAVGDLVRAHSRDWNEKEFYEIEYPKIEFEVNLKIHLRKSGIGEK